MPKNKKRPSIHPWTLPIKAAAVDLAIRYLHSPKMDYVKKTRLLSGLVTLPVL